MVPSNLDDDFLKVKETFPKLKHQWNQNHKLWIINGRIDICDTIGDYWGYFDILIEVPNNYPYCIPVVKEVSRSIPRDIDRHISEDGVCCVDIEHNLIYLSKKGVHIYDFILEKVYPYFANQVFFESEKEFAGEEYEHGYKGVEQFYREHLGINESQLAILIIQRILKNNLPNRNDTCLCGKGKYKKCHQNATNFLMVLTRERLIKDMAIFLKIYNLN